MRYLHYLYCLFMVSSIILTTMSSAASRLSCSTNYQRTLNNSLVKAITSGKALTIVKRLVQQGARINSRSVQEQTPLRIACSLGSLDVVEYLLAQGAEITRAQGRTAISETPSAAITEVLLRHGQDPNGRSHGMSELIIAAKNMHGREKVKVLLQYGARIHDCAEDQITFQHEEDVVGDQEGTFELDDDDNQRNPTKTVLYCTINGIRTILADHFEMKMKGRGSSKKTERAAQRDRDLIPTISLLLCNDAVVSEEVLACIATWIFTVQEDIDDARDAPLAVQEELPRVKSKLLEIQKILKATHEDQSAIHEGDGRSSSLVTSEKNVTSILKHTLSRLDLTASARKHVGMSQRLRSSTADELSTRYVIDPYDVSHSTTMNIFKQVMQRQAGQSRTLRPYCNGYEHASLLTANPEPLMWPTRAASMGQHDERTTISLVSETENMAAHRGPLNSLQQQRARSDSKESID